jgi:hypothetical protein
MSILSDQAVELLMNISTGQLGKQAAAKYPEEFGITLGTPRIQQPVNTRVTGVDIAPSVNTKVTGVDIAPRYNTKVSGIDIHKPKRPIGDRMVMASRSPWIPDPNGGMKRASTEGAKMMKQEKIAPDELYPSDDPYEKRGFIPDTANDSRQERA